MLFIQLVISAFPLEVFRIFTFILDRFKSSFHDLLSVFPSVFLFCPLFCLLLLLFMIPFYLHFGWSMYNVLLYFYVATLEFTFYIFNITGCFSVIFHSFVYKTLKQIHTSLPFKPLCYFCYIFSFYIVIFCFKQLIII